MRRRGAASLGIVFPVLLVHERPVLVEVRYAHSIWSQETQVRYICILHRLTE